MGQVHMRYVKHGQWKPLAPAMFKAENGFIVVHDAEYEKLGSPAIGSEFEINDHRAEGCLRSATCQKRK